MSKIKLSKLGDVQNLLVQDAWLDSEDPIWRMKLLKVAVKITYDTIGKPRGQKYREISFPYLWELLYQYNVSHEKWVE